VLSRFLFVLSILHVRLLTQFSFVQAYHSQYTSELLIGNMALLPLRTTSKGPAPKIGLFYYSFGSILFWFSQTAKISSTRRLCILRRTFSSVNTKSRCVLAFLFHSYYELYCFILFFGILIFVISTFNDFPYYTGTRRPYTHLHNIVH
jgi:hypothetical protein